MQVILLGDGAVGKTSIANRFTDDKFAQSYKQTVGCDFFIRKLQLTRIEIDVFVELSDFLFTAKNVVTLQIWYVNLTADSFDDDDMSGILVANQLEVE